MERSEVKSTFFTKEVPVASKFLDLVDELNISLEKLDLPVTVQCIYNPTIYARYTFEKYVHKYCSTKKKIMYFGMNPGPWGMSQTGVPFGEISSVKDWLQIFGPVGKPPNEINARPVHGFDCSRTEISGKRFWGLFKDLCETPENFFNTSFVYNYLPQQWMKSNGCNLTPGDFKVTQMEPLFDICDPIFVKVLQLYDVKTIVAIGKFCETRAQRALRKYLPDDPIEKIKVESETAQTNHVELRPASYSPTIDHSAKYASRTNPGLVVHSFGDEQLLQVITQPIVHSDVLNVSVSLKPNDDGILYTKSMFGFELLHEKATNFDDHIRYLSRCIMKKAGISETSSVRHKTQTDVAVAGRIECDADARLNPKCVMLQGTWDESLSQAVSVDIDNLQKYSLFPGQVVVMKGINPRGDKFIAQEVYCDASLPIPDHRADMMSCLEGTLSMLIVAGPYTTSDNLNYEPLKDLVTYITTHKPHVVIMTGPFLDSEHSKVKDFTMAETFKSFFEKLIDSLGELYNNCPFTKIYIVSSPRDAFHVNIYPTVAYSSRRKHPNIQFIPDPSTLNISGIIVGVTSTDVLMHISQEEISLGMGGDRLSRMASHVLQQQSYYPLQAGVGVGAGAGALSVDAALWSAYAQLPTTPHLLVLPSNFRYFVKDVNGCVVVNPEHLAKGTGGGTFARVLVSAQKDSRKICAQILRI